MQDTAPGASPSQSYRFRTAPMDPAELPSFVHIGRTLVGEQIASVEITQKRLQVNPDFLVSIYKVYDDGREERAGYYLLYALGEEAHELMLSSREPNGAFLGPEHLTASYDQARALYLGMIVATGPDAQAFAFYGLKDTMVEVAKTNPNLVAIYVKPATADGLRLLRMYNFGPVSETSELWMLDVQDRSRWEPLV